MTNVQASPILQPQVGELVVIFSRGRVVSCFPSSQHASNAGFGGG